MNIGSLYTVKECFWLLSPSKKIAAHYAATARSAVALRNFAAAHAAYWSKIYNCEVTYFSSDSYIIFLEEDDIFKKVLTSDGRIGWTCFAENYNRFFEEVKTEQ